MREKGKEEGRREGIEHISGIPVFTRDMKYHKCSDTLDIFSLMHIY